MVNCPKCDYCNITDRGTCEGLVSDGKGGVKVCGAQLPQVMRPKRNNAS